MEGLDILGADREQIKKAAPYVGAGLGALVGALWTVFTVRYIVGARRSHWIGARTLMPFAHHKRISRIAHVALGVAAGSVVGAGAGLVVKKAVK